MLGFKNRKAVSAFVNIFAYSARKNKANGPAAYFMFKPETNSDSPSINSNGERFASNSMETYHIIVRGQKEMRYRGSCEVTRSLSTGTHSH